MEKLYSMLTWLDLSEATHWLRQITDTPLHEEDFLRLCASKRCPLYINVHGIEACNSDMWLYELHDKAEVISDFETIWHDYGTTHRRLITGDIRVKCSAWMSQLDKHDMEYDLEFVLEGRVFAPYFKSADVKALGDRMNEAVIPSPPNTTDVDALKLQVEQERIARALAEVAVTTAQKEIGRLEREYESLKRSLAETTTVHALALATAQSISHNEVSACDDAEDGGLLFPYATEQLIAMRDAAIKFWGESDRTKPMPHGRQKAIQGYLQKRLNICDRKSAELTVAIKPDTLPDSKSKHGT